MKRPRRLKIFTGNANPDLAKDICKYLEIELGKATVGRFPDGENEIQLHEGVRGDSVFVVQSCCPPVDQNWMELLILIRCIRDMSPKQITAVIPYYGYARQERKDKSHVPITAKLMADLLVSAGARHVVMLDLHASAIQGFFDVPTDHLTARPVIVHHLREAGADFETIVSPDQGGAITAERYADQSRLNRKVATIGKKRIDGETTEIRYPLGKERVRDKRVVILDDILATGGTVADAAIMLHEHGVVSVDLCAVHPVFAGSAFEKLSALDKSGNPIIRRIWTTDTIPVRNRIPSFFDANKIEVISVAKLLGAAIYEIYNEGSVSPLFETEGYLQAINGKPHIIRESAP